MYYLRTRPAADPIKFTLDKSKIKAKADAPTANQMTGNSPHKNAGKHMNGKMNGHHNENKEQLNGHSEINGVAATNGHDENQKPTMNGKTPLTTVDTNQENVDKEVANNADLIEQLKLACSRQNKEACMMCSS